MKRLLVLALSLCLLLGTAGASAVPEVAWQQGEMYFPDAGDWTYHYTYTYPTFQGEGPVVEALAHYFDLAFNEMTRLVLPMYAADPIMTDGRKNEVHEAYELTCQNERILSFLLTHEQTVGEKRVVSMRSVVFAISGEYAGDTLTLRGVAQVGDSSQQLAEAVLKDVWAQLLARKDEKPDGWREDLTQEELGEVFYPESAFYADNEGRIVFYVQPGDLRQDDEPILFTYSPAQLESLLENK